MKQTQRPSHRTAAIRTLRTVLARTSLMTALVGALIAALIAGTGVPAASAAPAAQGRNADSSQATRRSISARPAGLAGAAGLTVSGLTLNDRLIVVGPAALALDARAPGWQARVDGDQVRWEADAGRQSAAALPISLMDLPLDQAVLVGVEQILSDGSTLQTARSVTRRSDGTTVLGPQTETHIRRMLRLTPAATPFMMAPGLEIDTAGRLVVSAADPRLADLAGSAALIEPSIRATSRVVGQLMLADSTTGSSGQNRNIEYLCSGGVYAGVGILIEDAPAAATITSMDVSYDVWHSVDISDFRVGLFRNSSDFRSLYSGTQTGANWLHGFHPGLTAYNGHLVNNHYTLGTCATTVAIHPGYLDYWEITLYYQATATSIDLIADSITPAAGSVEAGSSVNIASAGRVEGTGTVGATFVIGYYLSNDTNITTADTFLRSRNESSATSPGDTFGETSLPVTIPAATSAGTYYLGMIVDRGGAVTESNESNNVAWSQISVTQPASSACQPSATALCLNNGRFRVSTSWSTDQSTSGVGHAVSMTDDTGYFWFFDSSNVEVVIKVLKGCAVNNHYWVFAAGLTNVQVGLVVEDTEQLQTRTYTNPLNQSFAPVQDTTAFQTCP